jgi:hypothetical protein
MHNRLLVLKSLVAAIVQDNAVYGGVVTYGLDFFLENYEYLREQITILLNHGLAFHFVLEELSVIDAISLDMLDGIVWYKRKSVLWDAFR